MSGKSIFDKLWERHVITGEEGEPQLMYVDQHYIHEVTSPQAFQGLRDAGRKVRRPELTFGTTDHNVPTVDIFNIRDLISKNQIDTLARNVEEFGIDAATHGSERQGIVHMVGPETGHSQPGKFIVCGGQPYGDTWRFWSHCFWYWNIRSGACICNAMHLANET